MESELIMVPFTASRDLRIVSPDGSMCMNFEEGQTRLVHKAMHNVALDAGLVPEGSLEPTPVVVPKVKSKDEEISEGLIEACKTLIVRGNPQDFTAIGNPRAASAKKLVNFDFKTAALQKAFEQAMFEVENDGNDSTEHPEPSLDTPK